MKKNGIRLAKLEDMLVVDGFDKFDCIKNMIALFQKMSVDGSVEGIKDV